MYNIADNFWKSGCCILLTIDYYQCIAVGPFASCSKASEAVVQRSSAKNVFLGISQNSQENTCTRVSFLIKLQACNFIKKETLMQVFSCEFWKISQNTFLYRTPLVTASEAYFFHWAKSLQVFLNSNPGWFKKYGGGISVSFLFLLLLLLFWSPLAP